MLALRGLSVTRRGRSPALRPVADGRRPAAPSLRVTATRAAAASSAPWRGSDAGVRVVRGSSCSPLELSAPKRKKAITQCGVTALACARLCWLHHPLHVGTRMPTLIRARLISSDTRETEPTGDMTLIREPEFPRSVNDAVRPAP